jgi:cytochrome c-type biogenesis protein CcmH
MRGARRRAAGVSLVVLCGLVGDPDLHAQPISAAQGSSASGVAPGDTALERRTRSVAAQLRCPVCQGLSLADSPSELALEMKDVVREQLRAGRTPEEVRAYFVAKYGEWILLEPPRRGINLLAYLLPAFAVIGGAVVIWLMLGRWTTGEPSSDSDTGAVD